MISNSRKLTYSATAAALAASCMIVSRFLPLKIMPLMVAALCFFIAFRCGFFYGFACIASSMLIAFLWGSVDVSLLLVALFFAPYSLAAFFLKNKNYRKKQDAFLRIAVVTVLFNAALAVIVFGFAPLAGKLFLGFNLDKISSGLSNKYIAYAVFCVIGSALAVGFDIMFLMADEMICKKLKLK